MTRVGGGREDPEDHSEESINSWRKTINATMGTCKWVALFIQDSKFQSFCIDLDLFGSSEKNQLIHRYFELFSCSKNDSIANDLIRDYQVRSLPYLSVIDPVSESEILQIPIDATDRYPEYTSVIRVILTGFALKLSEERLIIAKSESTKSQLTQTDHFSRELILLIVRSWYRRLFGMASYMCHGFFIDHGLYELITRHFEFVTFPIGDFTLRGGKARRVASVLSNNGRYLFVGNDNGWVSQIDLLINEVKRVSRNLSSGIICMAITHHGLLAAGSNRGSICIRDTADHTSVFELNSKDGEIQSLDFNDGGNLIVSCSSNGRITVWSVHLRISLQHFDSNHEARAVFCGNSMIASMSNGSTFIFGVDGQGPNYHLQHRRDSELVKLMMNCDRSILACVCRNHVRLYYWPDWKTKVIHTLSNVECACFHPSKAEIMVLGYESGLIHVMDAVSDPGRIFRRDHIRGFGAIRSINITPDGRRMIIVLSNHSIRICQMSKKVPQMVNPLGVARYNFKDPPIESLRPHGSEYLSQMMKDTRPSISGFWNGFQIGFFKTD